VQLDAVEHFLYPWIMVVLFLIAGISARYSLARRSIGEFLKQRCLKLLVPFFGGAFLLGWINGWVSDLSTHVFSFVNDIPAPPLVQGVIRYLINVMNVGVLWFLIELFAASLILALLRAIDRHDAVWRLAGRVVSSRFGLVVLVALAVTVWGSSMMLNTPLVTAFRNGIYWFVFLLGYYVFSHNEALAKLRAAGSWLMTAAIILGVTACVVFAGAQYTVPAFLENHLVNAYLWVTCLAMLGWSQTHMNGTGRIWTYLKNRSFEIYIVHYPFILLIAYALVTFTGWPMWANYIMLLVLAYPVAILIAEILARIPILRFWLFGRRKTEVNKV
jgi:peptidoglycan/LPS O-acetylase OafA/YrhL